MKPLSNRCGILLLWVLSSVAPATGNAQPEATHYRVDLIVFRHLDAQVQPAEVTDLHTFPRAIDPVNDEPPEELRPLQELSPPVQAVWDRLARSAGYRPLAWAAWEQDAIEFSPPVRIHGEEPLADAQGPVQRHAVTPCLESGDERAETAPGLDGEEPPPCTPFNAPDVHYVLDGQAQLRRSRFLHLDVHVVHREPGGQALPRGEIDLETGAARLVDEPPDTTVPSSWRVIELRQSRQVRAGEFHYFDGPVFGAIARITEVEPSEDREDDA